MVDKYIFSAQSHQLNEMPATGCAHSTSVIHLWHHHPYNTAALHNTSIIPDSLGEGASL
jgi:hypothetical protein